MDDLDFEPANGPVRVAGRFRPKANPKFTIVASTAAAASNFPNIPVSSNVSDTATSVDPVIASSSSTSEVLGILEPSGNNGPPTHCSVESSAFVACDVAEAQSVSDYCAIQDPVSCTEAAMSIEHGEIRLETEEFVALDDVSEAPITERRVKKGKENANIPHPEVESTTLPQPAQFESGEIDESSSHCVYPRIDVHSHMSPTFGASIAPNPAPNFQVNAESFAETTQLNEAVHVESTDKTFDEPGNDTNEDSFNARYSSDYDCNEDRNRRSENEKPVQKRKRTKKVPDEQTEEQTKKKFSHSTRSNRRLVNKSLLETPEDEIECAKVVISDLLQLGRHRDRLMTKEAAKLTTPATNQRDTVCTSTFSLNYQSYMEKPRRVKWSEHDTELFFKVIKLFGIDFKIIALFFPGQTRETVKFKYKKEVRQNRLRIYEALCCRSKDLDYSKFKWVINELKKVARERQESNADESSDMEGQEEEEPTHDNTGEVRNYESTLDKIEDMETDAAAEVEQDEADGDDFGGWDDDF